MAETSDEETGWPESSKERTRSFPLHGWLGCLLVAVFWYLNWSLPGPRTHWGFFPLWLGYCLLVDALVFVRKGSSMATRRPWAYVGLFLVSAPAWWLFEVLNYRTQNWIYHGTESYAGWLYLVLASISFSTVMPAVFGTADLMSTFGPLRRLGPGPRVPRTPWVIRGFFVTGLVMLVLLLIWPRYFFPFLWGSVYFVFDAFNAWLGYPSILDYTERRDWRPVLALWAGVLICGFFWEMWNYRSYPQWIYQVPYVGVMHVFEMPLPGYLGYLPFSLELFALYHLVMGLLRQRPLSFL